jgi:hypothetical protein
MTMRTKLVSFALFGILAALGACSSGGKAICDDTVAAPGGPVPRVCVHEVPNGGSVTMDDKGNSIVTVDGGVVATYPPCPCDAGLADR